MSISPNENACVLCEKDLVNLIAISEEVALFSVREQQVFFSSWILLVFKKYAFKLTTKHAL